MIGEKDNVRWIVRRFIIIGTKTTIELLLIIVKAKKNKQVKKYKINVFTKAKLTQREMEIKMVPYFSMQRSLYFLSDNGLMSLSYSEYNHQKILGEIPASFMGSSHKMGQVSYDF